jgi:hypothetical protein
MSKLRKSKQSKKQQKTQTYDIDYFYNQRYSGRKTFIPESALNVLNIRTKINMNIKKERLEKLKTFNKAELEKKINGNLNKLCKDNIKPIIILIKAILKEKNDVLLDYTVKNLLNKAISQPSYCDLYAEVYQNFHSEESRAIFDKIFKDLIDLLEDKYENTMLDKNYDLFCKNVQDKTRFIGLFNFITALYHKNIVNRKTLGFYIDYLFNKLDTEGSDTEKYIECLCKFLTKINDKKIFQEKLEVLQRLKGEKERISARYRFMIMDLLDLYKKM